MKNFKIEELDTYKIWKSAERELYEFVDSRSKTRLDPEYEPKNIPDYIPEYSLTSKMVVFNEQDYMKYTQMMEHMHLAKAHMDEEIALKLRLSTPDLREAIYDLIINWYSETEYLKKNSTTVNPPIQDTISVLVDAILSKIKLADETSSSN